MCPHALLSQARSHLYIDNCITTHWTNCNASIICKPHYRLNRGSMDGGDFKAKLRLLTQGLNNSCIYS